MKGQILSADGVARSGLILGDDGNRYRFGGDDWKPGVLPRGGAKVDFVADGEAAREIFALPEPGSAAPRAATITQPGDRSVMFGLIGLACLALNFVVPPLPLLGSLIFGLLGAGAAKRTGNSTGLILGRISWIGSLVVALAIVALVVWALIYAAPLFDLLYLYIMHVAAEAPRTA